MEPVLAERVKRAPQLQGSARTTLNRVLRFALTALLAALPMRHDASFHFAGSE
jgi:hypothetical protein